MWADPSTIVSYGVTPNVPGEERPVELMFIDCTSHPPVLQQPPFTGNIVGAVKGTDNIVNDSLLPAGTYFSNNMMMSIINRK